MCVRAESLFFAPQLSTVSGKGRIEQIGEQRTEGREERVQAFITKAKKRFHTITMFVLSGLVYVVAFAYFFTARSASFTTLNFLHIWLERENE